MTRYLLLRLRNAKGKTDDYFICIIVAGICVHIDIGLRYFQFTEKRITSQMILRLNTNHLNDIFIRNTV